MTSPQTPGIQSGRLSQDQLARNFEDLHAPYDAHEAAVAADRCYFCHDAPCVTACPTEIDIPLFIRQIATGQPEAAAKTIFEQNILGGMCARVCPTETLCEEACVRETAEGKPVEIGRLQRYSTDALMSRQGHPFARAPETGKRVAVVGAGGIGFDVSEFLTTAHSPTLDRREWMAEWGAVDPWEARGAVTTPLPTATDREVYLLQRSAGPQGRRLGKTTGWVHRASLRAKGVQQLCGVNYERIDDDGLHISFGPRHRGPRLLDVDNVVICAGQEPVRDLDAALRRIGLCAHVIGGAAEAVELDAKRAGSTV